MKTTGIAICGVFLAGIVGGAGEPLLDDRHVPTGAEEARLRPLQPRQDHPGFGPATRAGTESVDFVYIIDGSGSIGSGPFALQRDGVKNSICGPSAWVPTNGTVAVGVIQFSGVVVIEVPLTVIDSATTAQNVCDTIDLMAQLGGGTALTPALDAAFDIFSTQAVGSNRHLLISTDAGVQDAVSAEVRCEDLRTMTTPVRICTALVGVACSQEDEFLKTCANTQDSQTYDPAQPEGVYSCVGNVDEYEQACAACICLIVHAGDPDCNCNGIADEFELLGNDCNSNDIPDECELVGNDCNGDGRPDECGVVIDCDQTEDLKLTVSDAAANDYFGGSVSVSGDTAIVGRPGEDCASGINCGSAYIYRFNGSTWIEEAKLTASGAAEEDWFGSSVSISGDTVVVGAYGSHCAVGFDCGSAYVFRFDGSNWVEEAKLTASDATWDVYFGASVSVSGDTVVVGTPYDDCAAGSGCGSAYVYRFDGSSWVEEAKLTAFDAARYDYFGTSVSVSGDTVVVGAYGDDNCTGGFDCGSAYVYRFDEGSWSWLEEAKLTASDAATFNSFGVSVSVSGNTVVVGAPGDYYMPGVDYGSAYVYRFDEWSWSWLEEAKLTASDTAANEYFGGSVSVSGDTAVVGGYGDDCTTGDFCGSAYVYRFDEWSWSWLEAAKLTASDAAEDDHFGLSVSISGGTAFVGAYEDNCTAGLDCGSAYVFDLNADDCNCNAIADECEMIDCNDNCIDDAVDIATLTSWDCNTNGMPDECEMIDCNENCVEDADDIANLTSGDCNSNGVPDECEMIDCNENCIDDAVDLATQTSRDCNFSGIPDDCELVDNDCNGDGRPDECGAVKDCDQTEDLKLTAPDAAAVETFGHSVSVSGYTAIVGAEEDDCAAGGSWCGSAYVYRFDGSSWVQEAKLTATWPEAGDLFGTSVSVAGELAVVGASGGSHEQCTDCGSAFVYRFDGSSWVEEAQLIASDAPNNDTFGISVSVSGDTAVVGAEGDNCGYGGLCGSVYVFHYDGSSWVEQTKLTTDWWPEYGFGWSVSVSGDRVVVGASQEDWVYGSACGAAYIYRFDGSSWVEEARLTASDATEYGEFGRSVSISGDRVVVGARWDYTYNREGTAYVFRFDGSSWVEEAKLTASDASWGDHQFGSSVSISGDTAVVGASRNDCADGADCGSVYVYRFDGSGWVEEAILIASAAEAGDTFGRCVSVSGDTAVVGAFNGDCPAEEVCGSAYVFNLSGEDSNCDGEVDVCVPLFASPLPDPLVLDDGFGTKNRYVSFVPNNPGQQTAVRVTLTGLPAPYDIYDGLTMWVGAPVEVSENAGKTDPADAPGFPTFWTAPLQCDSYYTDWSAFPVVYVYDATIVPRGVYDIQALGATSNEALESSYSAPLTVTQSQWGDVISDCGTTPCGPPDGVINVTSDVTSVLNKFKNLAGAPLKARSDLDMSLPDQKINISDVTLCLEAFGGFGYPFTPGPAPCGP